MNPQIFGWPLELGIWTHKTTNLCGPLFWGYGLMNPQNFVWPLGLGIWTHETTNLCGLLSRGYGLIKPQIVWAFVALGLRLEHWNIWRGGPDELHQSVRGLLNCTQFCIQRQVHHPTYGPWDHVPPHVWTDKSNSAATQNEREDEVEVCVLCCQKRSTITVCGECKEHYCAVSTPTFLVIVLFVRPSISDMH